MDSRKLPTLEIACGGVSVSVRMVSRSIPAGEEKSVPTSRACEQEGHFVCQCFHAGLSMGTMIAGARRSFPLIAKVEERKELSLALGLLNAYGTYERSTTRGFITFVPKISSDSDDVSELHYQYYPPESGQYGVV
ncbi:hypothetical protein SELMODRAFT_431723 [Selaginella moellendorffii]|uniref:Uncharacterized protein n=1 Tax=Selaginella moellendorffii TaxID=88036 RepID=D8TDK6_SELML|nr:hypothetical protein SELMODRAFT_431723 [Selaginella moellendorffii]